MATQDPTTPTSSQSTPFGSIRPTDGEAPRKTSKARGATRKRGKSTATRGKRADADEARVRAAADGEKPGKDGSRTRENRSEDKRSDEARSEGSRSEEARSEGNRRDETRSRGGGSRGRGKRRSRSSQGGAGAETTTAEPAGEPRDQGTSQNGSARGEVRTQRQSRGGRRRRKGKRGGDWDRSDKKPQRSGNQQRQPAAKVSGEVTGMLFAGNKDLATLRSEDNQYLPQKSDVFVPKRVMQRFGLRDGAIVNGRFGAGQGQHKRHLEEVVSVDGKPPKELTNLPVFKKLTSIDPDFHYALGDFTDDVSMRIVDVLCPVGRGTRGLIVAPPRSGKTILMRKFAQGIQEHYPDVHLIVLLVDERPEEATEWRRSTKGQVFVSTNDESPRNHVNLAEAVWKRCTRLVELGEDVILLLDSITRLARAYNNLDGGSGRTLSGGLDSRSMERPKQFFGSARNTETAGSLTILGTTLVETGSRLDQVVFEEFKGTGNMELVLSRKLSDRRIFPAIDVERSGTRKEEKLLGSRRLKQVHTLRRVLARMNFIEAMELLITKMEDVEATDDFLQRFDVDPEA